VRATEFEPSSERSWRINFVVGYLGAGDIGKNAFWGGTWNWKIGRVSGTWKSGRRSGVSRGRILLRAP
jgi:hypothetical protein